MYYMIKYGYNGMKFSGFQRGNGTNSVEDNIIKTLNKYQIATSIESAARTDRYVSALGNVFLIETGQDIDKIMRILNARIKNMFFISYAILDCYFNPRHNTAKYYSYIMGSVIDIEKIISILKKFEGKHDFINFCRADGRNTIRTIDSVNCWDYNGMHIINFYGKSFVWHQLRSIIAYAERSKAGDDPFSLEKKFTYLADPEPLILMDIIYDGIKFTNFDFKHSKKYLDSMVNNARIESTIYDLLYIKGNIKQ
ncbi:MAG: hypothetical protein QXZ44_02350 [Ferroplasma sp.]